MYINSTIIASSTVGFAFLVGFMMTTQIRKEIVLRGSLFINILLNRVVFYLIKIRCSINFLVLTFIISLTCSFGVNWAQVVPYMLTLSATIVVTMRIAGNIVIAVNAEVIPAPLR